ncbi:DUF6236 family protein [Chryseobacterium camelliae]|uniref:DUF6236 family protein n=1 Tax=Chryseobacterium camelliae TaxID=1265445 RepID=UPI000C1CAB9B|nr:DUF6236 family protein [Chryseobacterium camelliae]
MKRGIITNTGKTKRINSSTISISGNLSTADLNYYILYWDRIVMPTNNIIHQAIPNEEYLIKLGILERPIVRFNSWSTNVENGSYDPFVVSQGIIANKLLLEEKDTDWTIHQIGEEVIIAKDFQKKYASLKVGLLNCLPVPIEGVNSEILLEFKNKRKDEFEKLHQSIDHLYLEILKSPDIDLQYKISKSEFIKALQDIEKISTENFAKTQKYDLTTEININGKDFLTAIAAGSILDFTQGFTFPFMSVISGLISMVSIKANKTTSLEASNEKLKLSYIANASKENII